MQLLKNYRAALLLAFSWLGTSSQAEAAPLLHSPVRMANGTFQLRISGTATTPMILQASRDGRPGNWTDVQTVNLTGADVTVVDPQSGGQAFRFYRLKAAATPVVQLPDLSLEANRVFLAGEGFNTIQFAPSGALGLIVWRDQTRMALR